MVERAGDERELVACALQMGISTLPTNEPLPALLSTRPEGTCWSLYNNNSELQMGFSILAFLGLVLESWRCVSNITGFFCALPARRLALPRGSACPLMGLSQKQERVKYPC